MTANWVILDSYHTTLLHFLLFSSSFSSFSIPSLLLPSSSHAKLTTSHHLSPLPPSFLPSHFFFSCFSLPYTPRQSPLATARNQPLATTDQLPTATANRSCGYYNQVIFFLTKYILALLMLLKLLNMLICVDYVFYTIFKIVDNHCTVDDYVLYGVALLCCLCI